MWRRAGNVLNLSLANSLKGNEKWQNKRRIIYLLSEIKNG
ncbi:hypothetical protein Cabys_3244 [Caldithrix abyssi DSM 13497]|uniref:Uncharacterized protein n=1 Tax=Caldithrix abyssi DSM 13497 TaxID=880073 RepID=A0A1J1CDL3_CALAY|nr:hypothetical protein Cabys_3244 [Caldithrix abyssi DSM 13497]